MAQKKDSDKTKLATTPKAVQPATTPAKPITQKQSAELDDALANLKPAAPKSNAPAQLPDAGLSLKDAQTSLSGNKPPPDAETPLSLPPGALAALRRSGGLRFASREVIVFADGRVSRRNSAFDSHEKPVKGRASEAQLAAIKAALAPAAFASSTKATQTPDGHICEVAGWVNGKPMLTETTEGAVPAALKPLLTALKAVLTH